MPPSPAEFIDRLPDAFRDWLGGRRIEEVECIVPDIAGISRGKAMPFAKFMREDRMFLPTSIFHQTISGDYVDMDDANQWTESDMVLKPDYDAATAAPWADDVTLQVIHNVEDLAGEPVEVAPRNVLKRVVALYEAEGWRPVVAPEMEFYLIKPNLNPNEPIEPPMGRTGRQMVSRQAYSMSRRRRVRQGHRRHLRVRRGAGLRDRHHHPGGRRRAGGDQPPARRPGEARRPGVLLQAHDPRGGVAQQLLRDLHGQADAGRARLGHAHPPVGGRRQDRRATSSPTTRRAPTKAFHGFLAGQQRHIPTVVCMLAPYVNSYRRFVPGGSAPINLEWGPDNRTTGIRVPIAEPEARRVENRVVGHGLQPLPRARGLARLRLSRDEARAEAARGGVGRGLPPAARAAARPAGGARPVRGGPEITEVLGAEFCALYKAIKRDEVETFLRVISPWERDHLLLNV